MDENITLEFTGFEWDHGNQEENWIKHDVSTSECEQIFFNDPLLIYHDQKHSTTENRMYALGQTDEGKNLFIVIIIRNQLIRVISARDMSKREREIYAKT